MPGDVETWIIALNLLCENAELTAFRTHQQGLGLSVSSPLPYSLLTESNQDTGKALDGLDKLCA